jgi:hypothetical protein
MPCPTYLRLQLQKFDFIKKAYVYPSVIDIEKAIKTIHDIHLRLGGLFTAAILDTDDKGCCDYLEASYLREVWAADVALQCTYMFVLTCSFTVRSVYFRTSPANALLHISLEMRLEYSYHCVVFLSVHSSNSTLVLFCLVTLFKPSFRSITIAPPGFSLQPAPVPRPQYRYSVIWREFSKFFKNVCSIENHQQQVKASQTFQVFGV